MSEQKQAIVLVHGLWLKSWVLLAFKHFFSKQGFVVYGFSYASSSQEFTANVQQLANFVNDREQQVVHIIAHSMGGLLTIKAEPKFNKRGKVVFLASPIHGSKVAKRLSSHLLSKQLLRHAALPLIEGAAKQPPNRPCQMIIGNKPYGIGRLIYRFSGENDGTVSIASSKTNWLKEHHIINTNHVGILGNRTAMDLALRFLQHI